MICRWPSTAACALYACSKLFVAGSFMIRESGSVKLRCALGAGRACSGSGTLGTAPLARPTRPFLGLGLQRRPGLADLPQPALAPRQLCWELVAAPAPAVPRVLGGVDLLRLVQQLLHLALQLPLALLHTRIAHRLVLGGVGLDPRAVQRDVTERHQASPLTEQQPLHEKAGERREMPLAKLRDRVVIGMLVGGQYSKGDVLVGRPLDLSRRRLADAIRVEQELHHHGWVVGGLPTAVAALVGVQDG